VAEQLTPEVNGNVAR